MEVSAVDLYELIGFLKTQYIYKSSESKKCKENGLVYPLNKLPGDTLFELVGELERAIKEEENIYEKKHIDIALLFIEPKEIICPDT
jgi:hypothetical protein